MPPSVHLEGAALSPRAWPLVALRRRRAGFAAESALGAFSTMPFVEQCHSGVAEDYQPISTCAPPRIPPLCGAIVPDGAIETAWKTVRHALRVCAMEGRPDILARLQFETDRGLRWPMTCRIALPGTPPISTRARPEGLLHVDLLRKEGPAASQGLISSVQLSRVVAVLTAKHPRRQRAARDRGDPIGGG